MTAPHDVTDLYLAPVLLALDARIEDLGRLGLDELRNVVALESDTPDRTAELRVSGLLRTVTHLIDTHGWTVAWTPRGIEVGHGRHRIVLGVPDTFREFVG